MYVTKCNEVTVAELDDTLLCKADAFFGNNTDGILYVVKGGVLLGIVTRIDYNKNKENGNILNRNYKKILCTGEKSEVRLMEEAYKVFEEYKNISELPVTDENGRLLFSFIRTGTVYDVLPGRFHELYGFGDGFAEYIKGFKKTKIRISADVPQIMERYLSCYMDENAYELVQEKDGFSYGAEELFREYEFSLFRERVQKYGMRVLFCELPSADVLERLTKEEAARVKNAKKRTTQYYLQNYSTNSEVRGLVDRVMGDDIVSGEFIDALRAVARVVFREGICRNAEYSSKYVNVVNGRRVTTDVPQHTEGHIYMFGPCTVFGVITEDKYTIASCLQRILNKKGIRKEVVNEGMDASPILEAVRKFNRSTYYEDDIVLFFVDGKKEWDILKPYFPDASTISLSACYNKFCFHDYFLDSPVHPNRLANEEIANYLSGKVLSESEDAIRNAHEIPMIIDVYDVVSDELTTYVSELKKHYRDGKNGAIVMNCNPFTNGHLYLIEYAAARVDNLYVFIVSEDKSCFAFSDRIRLVKEGIRDRVNNVIVIPSGKYVLSAVTFPEYFTKEDASDDVVIDTSYDLEIFARHIAPTLNITVRFAGEEPYDVVTRQYNRDMEQVLPKYGIRFECVPRKCITEKEYISASNVRKYWMEGNREEVKCRVPESTYRYLFPEG